MFEYRVLPYITNGDSYISTMEGDLKRLGEEEWELVSAVYEADTQAPGDTIPTQYVLFLKKRV